MDGSTLFSKPGISEERREFYRRLGARNATPLWEVLGELVTPVPRPAAIPALWRYSDLRPLMMEAGSLISAHEAERRVLVLENPGLPAQSRITQSLYAGLQLVLPGETAPGHRHVAAALRFVVEGTGAYTAVNGERATMHPGDFILTPSWTFHDHGNPSNEPVVWLDGLDIPMVNFFNTSFAERDPGNLKHEPPPVFVYPYEKSRSALETLRKGPLDVRHGVKMQYVNPATGGYPMPTIAAFLQWLPSGFESQSHRATDGTVYCVVEGSGSSQVGEENFEWREHDVFVVPSWCPVRHTASRDAVLFSFSDRPAQKSLGIWREA
jgi:gentisate 1,2-dioxygenase